MSNNINSNISITQVLTAQNAFKTTEKNFKKTKLVNESNKTNNTDAEAQNETKIKDSVSPKTNDYINEVKNYAKENMQSDISNEDISYAIRYGRSILVDQTA